MSCFIKPNMLNQIHKPPYTLYPNIIIITIRMHQHFQDTITLTPPTLVMTGDEAQFTTSLFHLHPTSTQIPLDLIKTLHKTLNSLATSAGPSLVTLYFLYLLMTTCISTSLLILY